MPDMSIVPNKYHTFISSPLRRVFLDAPENNSRAVIKNLNAEIAVLKERVTSLKRDKDRLEDRYLSAQHTVTTLRRNEHNAHLALEGKQNLNSFRPRYDTLKSHFLSIILSVIVSIRTRNHPAVKRTRGQATLDDDSSSSEPESSISARVCSNGRISGRVIKPIPIQKRAKIVDLESSSESDTSGS